MAGSERRQQISIGEKRNTHDVDHGRQEVDEDRDEDDDVARRVRLVDPAAGFAEDQRQTLVVLRRRDQDQTGVEDDEDRELDHHGNHPVETVTSTILPSAVRRGFNDWVLPTHRNIVNILCVNNIRFYFFNLHSHNKQI